MVAGREREWETKWRRIELNAVLKWYLYSIYLYLYININTGIPTTTKMGVCMIEYTIIVLVYCDYYDFQHSSSSSSIHDTAKHHHHHHHQQRRGTNNDRQRINYRGLISLLYIRPYRTWVGSSQSIIATTLFNRSIVVTFYVTLRYVTLAAKQRMLLLLLLLLLDLLLLLLIHWGFVLLVHSIHFMYVYIYIYIYRIYIYIYRNTSLLLSNIYFLGTTLRF